MRLQRVPVLRTLLWSAKEFTVNHFYLDSSIAKWQIDHIRHPMYRLTGSVTLSVDQRNLFRKSRPERSILEIAAADFDRRVNKRRGKP